MPIRKTKPGTVQHMTFKEIRDPSTPQGAADLNDQIKKLVHQINAVTTIVNAPPPAPAAAPQLPAVAPYSFIQPWWLNFAQVNPDVRLVDVQSPLTLVRYGQYGVILGVNLPAGFSPLLYGTYGCWTSLQESYLSIPMWGNTQPTLTIKAYFAYLNTTAGIFYRCSPNNTSINNSDLYIYANYNGTAQDTTVWFASNQTNSITFPAPTPNAIHLIDVQYNGAAGGGVASWYVAIDGIVQAITSVNSAAITIVPQAYRQTWGAEYQNPTILLAPNVLPFDGVIGRREVNLSVTGNETEPAYSTRVALYDPRNIDGRNWMEGGVTTLTCGAGYPAPFSGSADAFLVTSNSIPMAIWDGSAPPNGSAPANGSGSVLGASIASTGFGGILSFNAASTSGTSEGATANIYWQLLTPNVATMPNLAQPDQQFYALIHSPVGSASFPPASIASMIRTLDGITSPTFTNG